jgi:DNA polymerase-3 subunit delta
VKVSGRRIDSFLKGPDPACVAVLIFGPDRGLVRERAETLSRAVVEDPSDPFCTVDLASATLKSDPARLSDEANAIPFGGGRKLVRVRDGGDDLNGVVGGFLESKPAPGSMVLIEGGDLPKRSKLRKVFESAENATAISCYSDDARSLRGVIADTLKAEGMTVSRDAMAYLAENLGSDREITRAELQKLALYKGDPGEISLADAMACVGDSAATSLDSVIYAAAAGNQKTLERELTRVLSEGIAPVAIIRSALRHFQRLHLVAGLAAAGTPVEKGVTQLRPPVIFLRAEAFKAQARRWNLNRVVRALELLLEAEADCKTTGLPAEAICGRVLLRIAQAAPH